MMKFPSGWYVLGQVNEFSSNKINTARRFGKDWIIRRNRQGQWIAQEDLCPHRSAKLSLGKLENDCIICPFHGFQFNDQGKCSWVPEIKRDAPGLRIQTHELTEKQGFLWIPWENPKNEIPWFNELNQNFYYSWSIHNWEKHFTRCVENQLDYAHLPFVHKTTIGKGFNPARQVNFEITSEKIKVDISANPGQSSYFEFRFGNIWKLDISPKMKQTIAFVPIDENRTRLYLRSYHAFTHLPMLRMLISWLLAPFNFWILRQDRTVVMTQIPNSSLDAKEETLFPSDRAIQAFRKWMKTAGDV